MTQNGEASNSFQAILSRTTTDKIKSRINSDELVELVLDVYMKPSEFARFMEEYYEREFTVTIN